MQNRNMGLRAGIVVLLLAIVGVTILFVNRRPASVGDSSIPSEVAQPATAVAPATTSSADATADASTPEPATTAAPAITATSEPEQPTDAAPTDAPEATPADTPEATAAAAEPGDVATLAELDELVLPRRDAVQLAVEFGRTTSTQREARTEPLPDTVGSKTVFWMSNIAEDTYYTTTATLHIALDHVLMYVEDGVEFDQDALEYSARDFNDNVYPRTRELFGEEWSPGIDGDPRITILNANISGAGGYFSGSDEVPKSVNRFSNEREMFYMAINDRPLGTPDYSSVLAHEFQHMIEWNRSKQSSATWFNEGMSQLSEELNGYGDTSTAAFFLAAPDLQLTDWSDSSEEPTETYAHYGASYLFLSYFYERYRESIDLQQLVHEGAGRHLQLMADDVREEQPTVTSFDDLFADWAVANVIDAPNLENGRWSYQVLPEPVTPEPDDDGDVRGDVAQYGADYVELPRDRRNERVYRFDGSDRIGVVPAMPDGKVAWWSNRGDDSVSTLTGNFDLTSLSTATLTFRTWYEIEDDYDYVFLAASTDGGTSWQTLPGRHTTTEDPQGANYGNGYTGTSGGDTPEWVEESVDLTPFAGKKILLRFSLITDDAYNESGMLLDDIRVPELDFTDDAEQPSEFWEANGWVRTDNRLPQRWELRLLRYAGGRGAPTVEPVELNAEGQGEVRLPSGERGVLVVAATTPYTSERASYTIDAPTPNVSGGQMSEGHAW